MNRKQAIRKIINLRRMSNSLHEHRAMVKKLKEEFKIMEIDILMFEGD